MAFNLGPMNKHYDVVFRIPLTSHETEQNEFSYVDIPAHKVILANYSDVFDAMFFGTGVKHDVVYNKKQQQIVVITDIRTQVFKFMIAVVYKRETNFKLAYPNFESVAYVAGKYNMDLLRQECMSFLSNYICPKNAVKFWHWCNTYNLIEGETMALTTIIRNLESALHSNICNYMTLSTWTAIMTSPHLQNVNLQHLLNFVIYYASTKAEEDDSVDDARSILKTLEDDIIKRFESNVQMTLHLYNPHFEVFFPRLMTLFKARASPVVNPEFMRAYPPPVNVGPMLPLANRAAVRSASMLTEFQRMLNAMDQHLQLFM